MTHIRVGWACVALAATLGCQGPDAILGCEPAGGLEPVCGFQNPEDLALLPGGDWLAVSQMARGGAAGSLVAYGLSDGERRVLWPGGGVGSGWGDAACGGPPSALAPHGIDLFSAPGGGFGLLVVNHGGRESVEMFELALPATVGPSLTWRGCVSIPSGWPNDVAALPGGGFAVTKMLPASPQSFGGVFAVLKSMLGAPTGAVLEWTPEGALREVPGSEAALPNGIALGPEGEHLFVAAFGERKVLVLDRAGGSRREIALPITPDNFSWSDDGRLVVAGGTGSPFAGAGCARLSEGACAIPFAVVAIDPTTLAYEVWLDHDGRTAFGAASVALPRGDDLWLGTFAGDRLARARRP